MVDDLTSSVGQSGTAHPLLVLASALESMAPSGAPAGTIVVALHLADGADAVVLRTTEALAAWRPARPVGRPGRQRRRTPLRQVPGLARPAPARAAAAPGAGPGVEHGRLSQRGVEVRLRRLEGPQLGRRPPAALAGLHGGWRRRRHGAGRHGRRHRHGGHLHHRPPGLLAEPAHRVRRRGLRRGRPLPGRADRRRPGRDPRRQPGRDDLPPAVQRRRHPRLLLEGAPGPQWSGGTGGEA